MKKKVQGLRLIMVIALAISVAFANAQNTTLPYLNGFESASDTAGWTFKQRQQNQGFAMGGALHCVDGGALYISPDSGVTAQAASGNYVSVAYFPVRVTNGTMYQMTFDYLLGGDGTSTDMRVAAVPSGQNINSSAMGSYPNAATNYSVWVGTTKIVFNAVGIWTHVVATFTATDSLMNIAFFYRHNTTGATTGVCVDNICITAASQSTLAPPTNIHASTANHLFNITWDTAASTSYEVVFMPVSTGSQHPVTPHFYPSGSPLVVNDSLIDDGTYRVGVRPICNGDTGHYGVSDEMVYKLGLLNFANLTGPGTVCTTGNFSNPYTTVGVVDYGQDAMESRHTVNYVVKGDTKIPNYLMTHPNDEAVTVRLGNWEAGSKAESISYTYQVPTTGDDDVLLLKNAPLYEEPGHSDPPAFIYELLDSAGNKLDSLDFVGTRSYSVGWNTIVVGASDIQYRQWTTTACDLSPFAGQTVHIRLTTKDCGWAGHYGYAYFALRFDDAVIKESRYAPGDSIEYISPDGFFYEWLDSTDSLRSTARRLMVAANDSNVYSCICRNIEDTSHKLVLTTADAVKLYPTADVSYTLTTGNCHTVVSFANNSTLIDCRDALPCVSCNSVCEWNVQSAHEIRSYHNLTSTDRELGDIVVSAEGDTLTVVFRIENEVGYDVDTMIIVVPQYEVESEVIDTVIQYGEQFCIADSCFTRTGTYTVTVLSENGECDSLIYTINLVVEGEPTALEIVSEGEVLEVLNNGTLVYSSTDAEVTLYDISGKCIGKFTVKSGTTPMPYRLESGVYVIVSSTGKRIKFVR